jgi:hypothetical protein
MDLLFYYLCLIQTWHFEEMANCGHPSQYLDRDPTFIRVLLHNVDAHNITLQDVYVT